MLKLAVVLLAAAAAVQGQDCGGYVTVEEGRPLVIQSPGYPVKYPNWAGCTWTVRGVAGKGLSFSATAFDLEGWYCYDSLSIGSAKFCGTAGPNNHLTGSSATVTFTTDGNLQNTGFKISVTVTDEQPATGVCGGNIVVVEGKTSYITSPGFPGRYPPNSDCFWTIFGPVGKSLEFNTVSFSTEATWDYLALSEVVDGAVVEFSRSSGRGPKGVRSRTNDIAAVFKSDKNLNFDGFNVSIKVADAQQVPKKQFRKSLGSKF